MKNYISNESGGWATSSGYVKHSFARSIHFGRMYTSSNQKGREEDLCEALRCLGQALHTLEDFGAHTNYVELALREMGFNNVFTHTGTATQINLRGKHVYPLITGTFGGVDFLHSVLGEATDHLTQSELDEMNETLGMAAGGGKKSIGGGPSSSGCDALTDILSKVPGTGGLIQEAVSLQQASEAQAAQNYSSRGFGGDYSDSRAGPQTFQGPPGSVGGPPGPGIPGMNPNMDPQAVIAKIYPILVFRDNVVRSISAIISKIPGLETLIDTITERVTLFVFSLLAPYIQPIITTASEQLKTGSSAVVNSSANHQYEPWTIPTCTDPTHSMLSKDHFSNILNSPAGAVASRILQYVAPRVIYAWDHTDVPIDQVLNDVCNVFHHPAIRDQHSELHRSMFGAVEQWVQSLSDRGSSLNNTLSSESVKAGNNHKGGVNSGHQHGGGFSTIPGVSSLPGMGTGSHSKVSGSPFEMFNKKREMGEFGAAPSGGAQQWQAQGQYQAGTVVEYNGSMYKCIQTHHADAANWTPDTVASLWTKIGTHTPLEPGRAPEPAYSPQPQWQAGGYDQQSFPHANVASPLNQDHAAYPVPSSYQQGYSDGGYEQHTQQQHLPPGEYGQHTDPYGYGGTPGQAYGGSTPGPYGQSGQPGPYGQQQGPYGSSGY
jgi:hypothetical protein